MGCFMITQLFKYRKLYITIDGITYTVNVPFYGTAKTFLAMDPDGKIFTYDAIPTFDSASQSYIIDESKNTYDLVAQYDGDTSKIYNNVIAILDKQYEYTFMEH